jgi:hypothetical protein
MNCKLRFDPFTRPHSGIADAGIIHPPQCLKSRIFSYVNMGWPFGRKVCKSTNLKARKLQEVAKDPSSPPALAML